MLDMEPNQGMFTVTATSTESSSQVETVDSETESDRTNEQTQSTSLFSRYLEVADKYDGAAAFTASALIVSVEGVRVARKVMK